MLGVKALLFSPLGRSFFFQGANVPDNLDHQQDQNRKKSDQREQLGLERIGQCCSKDEQ